jgi:1,4-alpha-glucan branching enzyme
MTTAETKVGHALTPLASLRKAGAETHAGMGAIPHDRGVAFRVWAPFARSVHVAGSFNDWSATQHPLYDEGRGYWYADISAAHIGDQYKYVIVNRDTGQVYWRRDPYAREVTNSAGASVVADPHFAWTDHEYLTPSWNELVIYEVHIGTAVVHPPETPDAWTQRTAPNDDDAPAAFVTPGTFHTTIKALPYLRDLGVNAIQIMPSNEFAGDVSWGYNPADIFAIESAYGGPHAFKEYVNAVHAHGMIVILDVVYNHFGPSDLDLWQFDGWSEHGQGGIYFFNDWRAKTP